MITRAQVVIWCVLVLLVLAVVAVVVRMQDHERALVSAYEARSAAKIIEGAYSRAFGLEGINGLTRTAEDPVMKPAFEAIAHAITTIAGLTPLARAERITATDLAVREYQALLVEPRGTWITYVGEMTSHRSRLDAAIVRLEQASSESSIRRAKATALRSEQRLIRGIGDSMAAATEVLLREAEAKRVKEEQAKNRAEEIPPAPTAEDRLLADATARGVGVDVLRPVYDSCASRYRTTTFIRDCVDRELPLAMKNRQQ